ncbi:hypothetical protein [Sediminicola sp. 1XM1-17]|uniref:hypothetical protein n=1 Tax=Sediminicola sp. 1XM1-17 TaxID=3127702 RepID=UPI003076EA35
MDLGLVIISVILVASVFVPFFIIDFSGKSGIKQMRKLFKMEVVNHNLKLTEEENWGNTFIGLDKEQKKLIFMKVLGTEPLIHVIDLSKVMACEIDSKVNTVKTKTKRETILQKLNLKITAIESNNAEVILNFYDAEGIYGEDFEFARAEKWKSIIKGYIHTVYPGKRAA